MKCSREGAGVGGHEGCDASAAGKVVGLTSSSANGD